MWGHQKTVYGIDDWPRYRRIQRMPSEERGKHPRDFVFYHNFQHFHWARYIMVKGGAWV